MINSWSLLYEELNGTMDKTYPIKEDAMTDKNDEITITGGDNIITPIESDEWDPIVSTGNTTDTFTFTTDVPYAVDPSTCSSFDDDMFASMDGVTLPTGNVDTDTINLGTHLPGGAGEDHIYINTGYSGTQFDDPKYYASSLDLTSGIDTYGDQVDTLVDSMGSGTKPKPDLKNPSTHKYQEDKGIADLKSYVTSTYTGHYTNNNSDTQTLDLIHSVGDAESFCRSNAIKYLSRYDKKGSAKQDILKAMHYCLLLYYFSGNTKEPDYTNTRYETF